jgi:hypothetical protein
VGGGVGVGVGVGVYIAMHVKSMQCLTHHKVNDEAAALLYHRTLSGPQWSLHIARKHGLHLCWVGQNHINTVSLAGRSPDIRSYMVYRYGSGQP